MNSPSSIPALPGLPDLPANPEAAAESPADPATSAGEGPPPRNVESAPLAAAAPDPKSAAAAAPPRFRSTGADLPPAPVRSPESERERVPGGQRNTLLARGPGTLPADPPAIPDASGAGGPHRPAETSWANAARASQQLNAVAEANLNAQLRSLGMAAELLRRSANLHETLLNLYRVQASRLDKLEKQLASLSSSNR